MKVYETIFNGKIQFLVAKNIQQVNDYFFNENGKVYVRKDITLEEADNLGIETSRL